MIKNIIFDIGNVLLTFEPKVYVKSKVNGEKADEIYESIFRSEEWLMLDRGTISEEDAKANIINKKTENESYINLVFENWYDILTPIEGSIEVLKKLKENGYSIFYLSNFQLVAFEYVTKKYDFFNLFNGGIVSFNEKLLKPETEIYEKIMDKYKLKPEETVFIDDTIENVKTAIKYGIKGIILGEPKSLIYELEKIAVSI
jgi:glucose-1-phosphatase